MSISGRHWLPGPVEVDPEVLNQMATPMIGHRTREGSALAQGVQTKLRLLFGTQQPVIMATCSGTGMMECAIRSGVEESMLAVVSGTFGERFARIGEACDREVIRLNLPRGEALNADLLSRVLDGPPVDAVSLVHVESSTGTVAPMGELISVLRDAWDPVIIVDAVASLGGMQVDPNGWDADFVLGASQKALAVPPGLSFAATSTRFLARAKELEARGYYLDALSLHASAASGEFAQTPALSIVRALDRQLDRITSEGLESRWNRHHQLRCALEDWIEERDDVALLATEGCRADTVSTLVLQNRSARELIGRLGEAGWQVGAGRGDEHDREIRIGHMGDVTIEQLKILLSQLEGTL